MASAASATADGGAGAGQPAGVVISPIQRLVAFQQAFWKFLRPHTIRGTILGSIAVTARALIESPVVRPCPHRNCIHHKEQASYAGLCTPCVLSKKHTRHQVAVIQPELDALASPRHILTSCAQGDMRACSCAQCSGEA